MYRFQNQNVEFGCFFDSPTRIVGFLGIILGLVFFLVSVGMFKDNRENFFLTSGQAYLTNTLTQELEKHKTKIKPEFHKIVENTIKEKRFGYATRIIINTENQGSSLPANLFNPLLFISPYDYDTIDIIASAIGKTQGDEKQVSWNKFWAKFIYPGLPLFWLIFGCVMFTAFAYDAGDRYDPERLVDLPWKKPWLWIFVVVTTPTNIPFFAGSGIRLLVERYKENRIRPLAESAPSPIITAPDNNAEPLQIAQSLRENYKILWRKARAESKLDLWTQQVEVEQKSIENHKDVLREFGEKITHRQTMLNQGQKRLRKLIAEKPAEANDNDMILYDEEFENLLKLPQIANVHISEGDIVITTKPVIVRYEDKKYDLGDYKITIVVPNRQVRVHCIRLSKNREHLYGNGDFCFGSRNELLDATLKKREFLPAICIALEALCYINPKDRDTIPQHYMEIV